MHIPTAFELVDEEGFGVEFQADDELEHLANVIIAQHPNQFPHLQDGNVVIRYLWKADGGSTGGRPTLGKCKKVSGLEKHFGRCDFVIWLAADHCRARHFGERQLEALLFHELSHIGVEVTEKGKTKYVTVPHDLEVFYAEIREYGAWSEDIMRLQQLPLFAAPPAIDDAQGADYSADIPRGEPHLHRPPDAKYPAAVCTNAGCTLKPRYPVGESEREPAAV